MPIDFDTCTSEEAMQRGVDVVRTNVSFDRFFEEIVEELELESMSMPPTSTMLA